MIRFQSLVKKSAMNRFCAFIFSFLLVTSAKAQDNSKKSFNADINITATVIQTIEIVTVQNIRLSGMDPVNNQFLIPPTTSANAGFMIARGNPDAEIRITYQPSQILNQINGDGIIRVNYQLSGNDIEEQLTSEILQVENRNFTFNSEGEFFIWVGGRVFIEQAKPGSYEGEFTVEIDYI